jgi:Mg2+ and Co2+ transporter CorA
MRIFTLNGVSVTETDSLTPLLTARLPEPGYLWISCTRAEFEQMQAQIQTVLQALCGMQLVDLHISDLLNKQLPSHYDYTSQYDVLVFRRLAASGPENELTQGDLPASHLPARGGPPILRRIDTSPVGFAVFDHVLLTVHPTDCAARDAYAAKLLNSASAVSRAAGNHLPSCPADMMLRIVNQMVDGYLELRRELSHQLDHWQTELLDPRTRFNNWASLLQARLSLHYLDEICEDQRSAVQDWIEALKTWPDADTPGGQRERDLLQVRSRDVLEHIERVVHHVRRLEQSAETAVQMHFNAQSHRTSEIMRTLTVLTAVFLPLNLIAGIFGMNFEFIPFLHQSNGFWFAMGAMLLIAVTLVLVFSRKRYLERSAR